MTTNGHTYFLNTSPWSVQFISIRRKIWLWKLYNDFWPSFLVARMDKIKLTNSQIITYCFRLLQYAMQHFLPIVNAVEQIQMKNRIIIVEMLLKARFTFSLHLPDKKYKKKCPPVAFQDGTSWTHIQFWLHSSNTFHIEYSVLLWNMTHYEVKWVANVTFDLNYVSRHSLTT